MSKDVKHRIAEVCKWYGYCKSGYYKHRKIEHLRQKEDERILHHIRIIRRSGIMCGARKMQYYLEIFFHYRVGRDRLFRIMEKHNLQCGYYKKHKATSTGKKSNFPYLIKDIKITKFGQVIVSDITYIHLPGDKFCYITIVSDLKTRLILGYNVSDSLALEGALSAVKMAVKNYGDHFIPYKTIHHSDHGVQYTSGDYTGYIKSEKIKISMTGKGKCYDNAKAERVFNTLKHEYGFKKTFTSIKEVRSEMKQFVENYNNVRIHQALYYKTPVQVYEEFKKSA